MRYSEKALQKIRYSERLQSYIRAIRFYIDTIALVHKTELMDLPPIQQYLNELDGKIDALNSNRDYVDYVDPVPFYEKVNIFLRGILGQDNSEVKTDLKDKDKYLQDLLYMYSNPQDQEKIVDRIYNQTRPNLDRETIKAILTKLDILFERLANVFRGNRNGLSHFIYESTSRINSSTYTSVEYAMHYILKITMCRLNDEKLGTFSAYLEGEGAPSMASFERYAGKNPKES